MADCGEATARRGARAWPGVAAIAASLLGCVATPAGNDGGSSGGSDGATAESGPSPGAPGAPCNTDADCDGGGACLPPAFFPEGDRVCGPPCQVADDCDALAPYDYDLEVGLPSPSGEGNNLWNSASLFRGRVCEAGHCQFLCPEFGAAAFDDADNVIGCACLPHFTFDDSQTHCIWDDNVQCALIEKDGNNPCDACNSEPLFADCHTGRFECLLYTETFAGSCVEWADSSELQACVAGNAGYDCDDQCYANCASAQCTSEFCNVDIDGCLDICCTATQTPPPPGGCDPTGGGDTGGGAENTPDACSDQLDNDGDSYIDCDASFPDFDCCGVGDCGCTGACTGKGACVAQGPENDEAACTDQADNDGDGYIDCDASFPDFDCCGVGSCPCTGACAGNGGCP
ncbi:MAG: hypothetical protein U0168_23495 [Nannocystaceae bacterium]